MRLRVLMVAAVVGLSIHPAMAHALCHYFNFLIDGSQVLPPSGVQWSGGSELLCCEDNVLRGHISLYGETSVTGVYIHGPATPEESAPVLFELPLPQNNAVNVEVGPLSDEQLLWLVMWLCYVDVRTTDFPDGAIRGQIHSEIAVAPSTWEHVKGLYR